MFIEKYHEKFYVLNKRETIVEYDPYLAKLINVMPSHCECLYM